MPSLMPLLQLGKSCLGAVKTKAIRTYTTVMHKKPVIRQMQIFRKTRSLSLTVMGRENLQLINGEIFIKNRDD